MIERALDIAGLPSQKNNEIDVEKFTFQVSRSIRLYSSVDLYRTIELLGAAARRVGAAATTS